MGRGGVMVLSLAIALATTVVSFLWRAIKPKKETKMTEHSKYCSKCGTKLNAGVSFCPDCGEPVATLKPKEVKSEAPLETPAPNVANPQKSKKQLWLILGVILIIFCAISIIGAQFDSKTTSWSTYNDVNNKFTVDFPCTPGLTQKTIAANGISLTQNLVQCPISGNQEFLVQYINYPASIDMADTRGRLAGAMEGMKASGKRTVQSSTDTTFQGYPATDFVVKDEDSYVFKGRNILVGNTLYSVMTVDKFTANEGTDKLVNSFRLK
jgi:hypothetical protein